MSPQPDIYPGNCWAFRGSQGYLVVRLSMPVWPATFTLEHIPKTLAPTGSIASAPKDFAVYVSVASRTLRPSAPRRTPREERARAGARPRPALGDVHLVQGREACFLTVRGRRVL